MIDTIIEHIGHPDFFDSHNSMAKFDRKSTMKCVQCHIEKYGESDDLPNYKCFIEIFHTEYSEYVRLDQDYIDTLDPFGKQNLVRLRVRWTRKSTDRSASGTIKLNGNITTACTNFSDNKKTSFHQAAQTSSIASQQDTVLFQDSIKPISQQSNGTFDELYCTAKLDLPNDDPLKILAAMQEQGMFEDDNWLDSDSMPNPNILSYEPNETFKFVNQSKAPNLNVLSEEIQQVNYKLPGFYAITNLLDNSCYVPNAATDNIYTRLETTTRSLGNTATSTTTHRHSTHYVNDIVKELVEDIAESVAKDTVIKSVKNMVIIPPKIRYIQYSRDPHCTHLDKDYVPELSNVPIIVDYERNKVLKFILNTDKFHRLQFLSNRDPVKPGSRRGRAIVRLQGIKIGVANKRACLLPKICIPDDYKQIINTGDLVFMCVFCVKEYDIVETEEIGYCVVSNKNFLQFVNTADEEQLEQLFIPLTLENTDDGVHELEVAIIKVTHQIDSEIGPALFRLSKQYVQTARSHGVEFGSAHPLHRLALVLLKYDSEVNKFVPGWSTLCLSNYIHQEMDKSQLPSRKRRHETLNLTDTEYNS